MTFSANALTADSGDERRSVFEDSTAQKERLRLFHFAQRRRRDDLRHRRDRQRDDENVFKPARMQNRDEAHVFRVIAIAMQQLMELRRRRQYRSQQQPGHHRADKREASHC